MYRDDLSTPAGELSVGSVLRRWVRSVGSVLLGALTAIVEFFFLLVLVLARGTTVVSRSNWLTRAADRWAVGLTAMEMRRLRLVPGELTPARSRRYIASRWLVGGLGGGVLLMFVLCLVVAGSMVSAWLLDGTWGLIENSGDQVDAGLIALSVLPGTMIIFAGAVGISGAATLDRLLAVQMLGTSEEQLLRQRVATLASTRAQVVAAINEERRRIERDLHDGVQQRLVALGMLVGRARRTAETSRLQDLLSQAHAVAQEAIVDLRGVAVRIYPSGLDEAGLRAALESLADRASVPIELTFDLPDRPDLALETVIYFVVSEAVTNAAKHAEPTLVRISVLREGNEIVAEIRDDGTGGADVSGTGLSGLARRVAAVDGSFTVDSPAGGPTVISARLPD